MTIPYIASEKLVPVFHGFFGREGGTSTGTFASNNMSVAVGDDPETVGRNRAAACEQLGFESHTLRMVKQVHSNLVVVMTGDEQTGAPVEADAMVTSEPGLTLGILTADCAPILLADDAAGVIAAVHAGWKGAVNGIIGATVRQMQQLGVKPAHICAAIGPTISAPHYEIGPEMAAQILAIAPSAAPHITLPEGKTREHFDLPEFVADQLRAAGIDIIANARTCTYAAPETYFSHRWATHHGTTTGRQISLIGLS